MKARLDLSKSQELEELMARIPNRAEDLINDVLRMQGAQTVMQAIIGFMPVSNRNKPHAKHSNPLKEELINLGFHIIAKGGAAKNKGSFGYLVFPNEGRGPHNPVAQEFFERGLDSKLDEIMDLVMDALRKAIEE